MATTHADKSGVSEEFGEGDGPAIGKLGKLSTARETVGQHQSVGVSGHGWQQIMLGHLDRHFVMAFLHPEVASQAAATADSGYGGSGRGKQGGIGLPAEHRGVVAMRLSDQLDVTEVWRRPISRTLQQLSKREDSSRDICHARIVGQQLGRVAAPNREAGGLQANDRRPPGDVGMQGVQCRA
jgi:hypothetical protein